MEWHEFGLRVRRRREELGISQQEIASALGIDQAKVSLIERGARKVDLVRELPALARTLKCSMSALVQEDVVAATPEDDPIRAFIQQRFPGVKFEEFEMRRIAQFLEPVLASYVENSPDLKKKVSNG